MLRPAGPGPFPEVTIPGMSPASAEGASALSAAWSWSPIAEDVSLSRLDSHMATVAVAADGTVYAVWQEMTASGRWMLHSSVRTGGAWSTPVRFYAGEQPDLAIGPDGRVCLVYANEMFDNYEVYYTTWLGDRWAASKNVSNTSGVSSEPAIAFAANGTPVIVWADTTGGEPRIYFARQTSGVWETYWVPCSSGGSAPDVARGKGGRFWATWQAKEAGQYDVFALFGDGQSWYNQAMNVSEASTVDSLAPRLAGSSSQGAFLVWQEGEGNGAAVYYADTVEGIDWWSAPAKMSQGSERSEQPCIVANAVGDLHVAYLHMTSGQGTELLHRRWDPATQQWLAASVIASDSANRRVGEVELAIGSGRELHALWSRYVSTDSRDIYYRSGSLVWPYHLRLPLLFRP